MVGQSIQSKAWHPTQHTMRRISEAAAAAKHHTATNDPRHRHRSSWIEIVRGSRLMGWLECPAKPNDHAIDRSKQQGHKIDDRREF
jgi:hypothetical protein